jgi:hypothetical protein
MTRKLSQVIEIAGSFVFYLVFVAVHAGTTAARKVILLTAPCTADIASGFVGFDK